MYNVEISNTIKNKSYFWYLYRCLKILADEGTIKLSTMHPASKRFEEDYYELIYINDYPIFFDLRDDFKVTKQLGNYFKDYTLFKGNFSTELWNLAKQDKYPEGFEYRLEDWELDMQPNIKAFALGRRFNMNYKINEQRITGKNPSYKSIVSLFGAGILSKQTETRLKVFDMVNIINTNSKLMFANKAHFKGEVNNYNEYLKKYPVNVNTQSYGQYIDFLCIGDYSLNVPGIALSTPFRFIDAVIANRNIITTKVWHDVYSTFPAVVLPICGYLGTGDWTEAERILQNLNEYNKKTMLKRAKNWYSWFLSTHGMWKNQILANLKGKI